MTHRTRVTQPTRIAVSLALLLCAPLARAQDDATVLATAVPPNVMILMDNSGSMAHALWGTGFDPNVFHDTGQAAIECDLSTVPAVSGSAGFCPSSGDPSDLCPDSSVSLSAGNHVTCTNVPGGCAAAPSGWSCSAQGSGHRFTLPDYTPQSRRTRWSYNYLHWLFNQVLAGSTPTIPAADRLETAKTAIINLIDLINPDGFNESARFGLANFSSSGSGGSIDTPVTSGNKNSLIAKIVNLQPSGVTPLAESMVDVIHYMSGDNSIGNCSGSGNISNSNPMEEWCRKNFVIALTDGRPVHDTFSDMPGGEAGFICAIGNADGDGNEDPTPSTGRTDEPPYPNAGDPDYAGTDWLDDVTDHAYHNDLRPDLPNAQNIVTYTVGFFIDHPLLQEAAENSTGEYYVATSADELADHLHTAVLSIIERSTSFSAATVPSSRTAFGDGFFVASFIPRNESMWEGHLEAYRIDSDLQILDRFGNPAIDATGTFIEPKQYFWDAAVAMQGQGSRSLYTSYLGSALDFTPANIAYTDLDITADAVDPINNPSPEWTSYPYDPALAAQPAETIADDLVRYLHGEDAFDEDRDGDASELRDAILGDLFHSNPIVIGPPPFGLASEDGYGPSDVAGTFLYQYRQRDRRLYVGGNDGMLHAFDTGRFRTGDNPATSEVENDYYDLGTGEEVFGWVPEGLLETLKFIPRNNPRAYYYMDGSPSAADVWIPSSSGDLTKEASEWTTLLVAGMRQGGRGYLALDVTDPSGTAAAHSPYPRFLWEFDDPSEPMGETWSEPIVTRVKMEGALGTGDHCGAVDGDGDCREQWVVLIGAGYDATADPNLTAYIDDPTDSQWTEYGKGLFVLSAETGQVLAKLERDPTDAQLANLTYAVPGTPAVLDLDFDGFADVVYLGDTGGQVWKWDLSAVGVDGDSDGLVDTWPAGIFFAAPVATLSGGIQHYRAMFAQPSAAYVDDELVLVFGTGERSDLKFIGSATVDENNRLYVIRDPVPTGSGAIPLVPYSESDLTDITGSTLDADASDLGYFIRGEEGEKFITSHIIIGGILITASYVPDDGSSGDICVADGSTFAYVLGLADGLGQFSESGIPARRAFAAIGIPAAPRVSVDSESGQVQLFAKGSSGQLLSIAAPGVQFEPFKRVFWRQRF